MSASSISTALRYPVDPPSGPAVKVLNQYLPGQHFAGNLKLPILSVGRSVSSSFVVVVVFGFTINSSQQIG
ncbi:hypothetical protein RP20_CCG028313 [Aedes albopictus]|nr:hypothetical protein RP20_CCG028313 [Aedes albopictus]